MTVSKPRPRRKLKQICHGIVWSEICNFLDGYGFEETFQGESEQQFARAYLLAISRKHIQRSDLEQPNE